MGFSKDSVERYVNTYIKEYIEHVKRMETVQLPAFCKGAPHHVKAYILPNDSAVLLFRYGAKQSKIEVIRERMPAIRDVVNGRDYHHLILLPPNKSITTEDATTDAKLQAGRDVEWTTYRIGIETVRSHVHEIHNQTLNLIKTNPWLEKPLKELADRLTSTREPLDKLWDDVQKKEREERYKEWEESIVQLEQLSKTPISDYALEEFIKQYITTYMETVKTGCPEGVRPQFFLGFPFYVKGFILPNESVVLLIKYKIPKVKIEISRQTSESVEWAVKAKEHDFFLSFPPMKEYTREQGAYDANLSVKNDVRVSVAKMLIKNARGSVGEHQKQIADIIKTNPWLEKSLNALTVRLNGVTQLLDVLIEEIDRVESGKRFLEHDLIFYSLMRFKSPAIPIAPSAATTPMPGKALDEAYAPYPQEPVYAPPMVPTAYIPPEDRESSLKDMKAELYNMQLKLEEFDRRLEYINRYVEGVQKQQNEKWKIQGDIVRFHVRKYRNLSLATGTASIILSIIVFLASYEKVISLLSQLFGF